MLIEDASRLSLKPKGVAGCPGLSISKVSNPRSRNVLEESKVCELKIGLASSQLEIKETQVEEVGK